MTGSTDSCGGGGGGGGLCTGVTFSAEPEHAHSVIMIIITARIEAPSLALLPDLGVDRMRGPASREHIVDAGGGELGHARARFHRR